MACAGRQKVSEDHFLPSCSLEDLEGVVVEDLTYCELQELAKRYTIKANQSREILETVLADLQRGNGVHRDYYKKEASLKNYKKTIAAAGGGTLLCFFFVVVIFVFLSYGSGDQPGSEPPEHITYQEPSTSNSTYYQEPLTSNSTYLAVVVSSLIDRSVLS
mmetsp:Transcript_2754/g.4613  ORF Transcript_2754/g.4613 Transcript_2754/m.4613 type:complete len:161 (+) Transcript_2754:2-484(+)